LVLAQRRERAAKDGRPRRCFDLRDHRLFKQFDDEESKAMPLLEGIVAPAARHGPGND
jgi:hypothetical protein